ncbi:MAG TPA: phytoene desaturase [Parasphingorhabdus sp.]
MFKKAAVIGSGFGGLALAIRLQSAGIQTTVVEGRDKPGGQAYYWEKDGFIFDAGPTIITDPDCLGELWELTGHDMAADIKLLPVSPFFRLNWPDGTNFDYVNDPDALLAEIAKIEPSDVEGYKRFLKYSEGLYEEGYVKLGTAPFLDFKSMVSAAPALMKFQPYRSVYAMVSTFVKNEKLRQFLSFQSLLLGGNPMTTSAIYALIHKLERAGGVWFPKGGTNMLVAAMVKHFERLGGVIRLSDPVTSIDTLGDRATGITCKSGWSEAFDAVASNADVMHSYRDLLAHKHRSRKATAALKKKKYSPSLFIVHFGLKGTWPGIPHHMMLFGPRYKGLLKDIYDTGVLPGDNLLYLHHPTITDPDMAPPGDSSFYVLAPVPHQGKLPIDWKKMGPVYEKHILDEIGHRLIPDIHDRIVTSFHYTPQDFGRDLNAYLGSPFSQEPLLTQSAWFRVHNRDDIISNLYFVGGGTHPGAGIPGVVSGAKATADLMIEDLG